MTCLETPSYWVIRNLHFKWISRKGMSISVFMARFSQYGDMLGHDYISLTSTRAWTLDEAKWHCYPDLDHAKDKLTDFQVCLDRNQVPNDVQMSVQRLNFGAIGGVIPHPSWNESRHAHAQNNFLIQLHRELPNYHVYLGNACRPLYCLIKILIIDRKEQLISRR